MVSTSTEGTVGTRGSTSVQAGGLVSSPASPPHPCSVPLSPTALCSKAPGPGLPATARAKPPQLPTPPHGLPPSLCSRYSDLLALDVFSHSGTKTWPWAALCLEHASWNGHMASSFTSCFPCHLINDMPNYLSVTSQPLPLIPQLSSLICLSLRPPDRPYAGLTSTFWQEKCKFDEDRCAWCVPRAEKEAWSMPPRETVLVSSNRPRLI